MLDETPAFSTFAEHHDGRVVSRRELAAVAIRGKVAALTACLNIRMREPQIFIGVWNQNYGAVEWTAFYEAGRAEAEVRKMVTLSNAAGTIPAGIDISPPVEPATWLFLPPDADTGILYECDASDASPTEAQPRER